MSSTKSEKQVRQAISDAEEGDGLPLSALREELAQRDARLQARALVAVRVGLYRPQIYGAKAQSLAFLEIFKMIQLIFESFF